MEKIIARCQFDSRPNLASDLSFEGDKGVTKQADAKDCDLNVLFKRLEKTGQLPNIIAREPRYGDFSNVPDYQEACNIVKTAEEQFAALPAELRNKYDNDPAKFLAFASDPKNIDELENMGLLKPEVVAERAEARRLASLQAENDINAKKAAEKAALIAEIKAELAKPA